MNETTGAIVYIFVTSLAYVQNVWRQHIKLKNERPFETTVRIDQPGQFERSFILSLNRSNGPNLRLNDRSNCPVWEWTTVRIVHFENDRPFELSTLRMNDRSNCPGWNWTTVRIVQVETERPFELSMLKLNDRSNCPCWNWTTVRIVQVETERPFELSSLITNGRSNCPGWNWTTVRMV